MASYSCTNSREQTSSRNVSEDGSEFRSTPGPGLFPALGFDDFCQRTDVAQWLDWGIVAAVMLAAAVALSLNVADPDLWGHVQYGRDALRDGLPATTTYSYVAEGYPWINHEILAEYALATVADLFGGPGLLMLKCLLGVVIVGAIWWRANRFGSGLMASCSLALLVAMPLGNHWLLRPQIASYVGFALLLALLSYCFAGWEGQWQLPLGWLARWRGETPTAALPESEPLTYSSPRMKLLWLAVPLFMVWTNAHGGFLAGLCVYLAYLGLRGAEAFCRNGRRADGLLRRFALMGAAAILATFLNPYGPNFHFWLWDDLKIPRPEILEWRSPELFNLQFLPFWLLLAAAVASLALSRRTRDFTHLVILALILWQALTHHRHIAFFALACGWWLPMHWDSLLARLGVGQRCKTDEELRYGWAPPESAAYSSGFSPRMQQGLAVLLVVAICISTGRLAHRLTTLKIDRGEYPVAAFEFIARQGLSGKMVCTFNWAQYALAAFGPREAGQPGILVHVDGRCRTSYSQAMLDSHFDFLLGDVGPETRYRDPKSGPFDPQRVLNAEQPDLVLVSRLQRPSVRVMEEQQGRWVLLYQDGLAQVWGRAARYDDPNSAYYLPPAKREVGEAPQRGFVRWPALPSYKPTLTATNRDLAIRE
jgi:hypothetical protein